MSKYNAGIRLPPWTRLIPKKFPGWYWVMRPGVWPKCIRVIHSHNGLKPAEPRDGLAMEEYTHFIGPVAEPPTSKSREVFAGRVPTKMQKPKIPKPRLKEPDYEPEPDAEAEWDDM